MEIVDVSEEHKAKVLATRQANMAAAQAARLNGTEGAGRDTTFWTHDDKGIPMASLAQNLNKEQPWHIMVMILKAKGVTNREIASRTGKSEGWISQLTRAGWFREQLEAMIAEEGREALQSVLEGEGLNSLYTLIDVRDSDKSKGSEKIAAANSLLDRLVGKAPQTVQHVDGGRSLAAQEQSRIEAELLRVDEALKNLTGHTNTSLEQPTQQPT